jgi:hypothetical protein
MACVAFERVITLHCVIVAQIVAQTQGLPSIETQVVYNQASRRGEMADARDLKSLVPKGTCGFESRRRHIFMSL